MFSLRKDEVVYFKYVLLFQVGDLRRELELRNISPKGLKSQLIARLSKILKAEQDKEQEDKEMEAEKAAVRIFLIQILYL